MVIDGTTGAEAGWDGCGAGGGAGCDSVGWASRSNSDAPASRVEAGSFRSLSPVPLRLIAGSMGADSPASARMALPWPFLVGLCADPEA